MTKVKFGLLLIISLILFACNSEQSPPNGNTLNPIVQDGMYFLITEDGKDTISQIYLTDQSKKFKKSLKELIFYQDSGLIDFYEPNFLEGDFNTFFDSLIKTEDRERVENFIERTYPYKVELKENRYQLHSLSQLDEDLFLDSIYYLEKIPFVSNDIGLDAFYWDFFSGEIILNADSIYTKWSGRYSHKNQYSARTLTPAEKGYLSYIFKDYLKLKDSVSFIKSFVACYNSEYLETLINDTLRSYHLVPQLNFDWSPDDIKQIALSDSSIFSEKYRTLFESKRKFFDDGKLGKHFIRYAPNIEIPPLVSEDVGM